MYDNSADGFSKTNLLTSLPQAGAGPQQLQQPQLPTQQDAQVNGARH